MKADFLIFWGGFVWLVALVPWVTWAWQIDKDGALYLFVYGLGMFFPAMLAFAVIVLLTSRPASRVRLAILALWIAASVSFPPVVGFLTT